MSVPILVTDHLPADPGYYLIWEDRSHEAECVDCEFCERGLPHGQWSAKFFDGKNWWLDGWSNGVTHWLPLPPAPIG